MALIYGTADPQQSGEISRKVKAGRLRKLASKLASKLYTDDLRAEPGEILRRHRQEIAAHFYPGAVISHRSALEGKLSPAGKFHISLPNKVAPVRKLPGLEIRIWQGPAAQADDTPTAVQDNGARLYIASQARAVLENFQIARARVGDEPKTLPKEALEAWFDRQLRILGTGAEAWLNELLENARALSQKFEWQREFGGLEEFVRSLKGKPSAYELSSDLSRARAAGKPYDPERIQLFNELKAALAMESFQELPAAPVAELENRAFWEAYFSNYIEGTKFSVEEAQEIVNETDTAKALKRNRPEDAHDILETYRLIVDSRISGKVAETALKYIELIKNRHARMMASRDQVAPGFFKERNNEVGSRVFVRPELVTETIARGWQSGRDLKSAIARAFFMLFVVSEVHPFQDGNGRISRLGMNAVLEDARQMRLILPTSFRNDYLTVLEALTINGNPKPFCQFAHKLIELNSRMPLGNFEVAYDYYKKTAALDEPKQGNLSLLPLIQ
jgi:hypothetical protein